MRYSYKYVQPDKDYYPMDSFTAFHKAYYLAGVFDKMFALRDKEGISLVEAAKKVQMDAEGQELSREFYYPSKERIEYFTRGKELLQAFDDDPLEFYYKIPDKSEE